MSTKKKTTTKTATKEKVEKSSKLMKIWTASPQEKEEKKLKLELSAAEISAKGDLLRAQTALQAQEEVVADLEQNVEIYISKMGRDWSPADIINAQIRLEEAEDILKQLQSNVDAIKKLMKEYL